MAFNRGASHGDHSSAADAAVADVFLLSTRAGGLGINLATVSHCHVGGYCHQLSNCFTCPQVLSFRKSLHDFHLTLTVCLPFSGLARPNHVIAYPSTVRK